MGEQVKKKAGKQTDKVYIVIPAYNEAENIYTDYVPGASGRREFDQFEKNMRNRGESLPGFYCDQQSDRKCKGRGMQ